MSEIDIIKKGMDLPRLGLIDQANMQLQLLGQYAEVFKKYGWTDETTRELIDSIQFLNSERSASLDARHASKVNRDSEQFAVSESKTFKRKLVHAFDDLNALGRVDAHVQGAVRRSGRLRRSPVLISGYLNDIRSHVANNNEPLKAYFPGDDPLNLLDTLRAQLDSAQGTQEAAYQALPLETRKVYEAKGRLLLLIERINRIGKIAFDGDAKTMALFNKDLILRARKPRSQSTVEAIGEAITDETGKAESAG